jgi:RHS repeat-associated protein
MVTDRGFLGQETDTAVGLSYLNNRYYDPSIGMFLSVDPLVATTGEAYMYGSGNPVTLSDPTGLCSVVYHEGETCADAIARQNAGSTGGSSGSAGGGTTYTMEDEDAAARDAVDRFVGCQSCSDHRNPLATSNDPNDHASAAVAVAQRWEDSMGVSEGRAVVPALDFVACPDGHDCSRLIAFMDASPGQRRAMKRACAQSDCTMVTLTLAGISGSAREWISPGSDITGAAKGVVVDATLIVCGVFAKCFGVSLADEVQGMTSSAWSKLNPAEPNAMYRDNLYLVATTWNGADRGSVMLFNTAIVSPANSFDSLTQVFGAVNPGTL